MFKLYYDPMNGSADGDNPNIFSELPPEMQQLLLDWIAEHIDPKKKRGIGQIAPSSYGLKHVFSRDTDIYIANGHFKGAMRAAGLRIDNPKSQNWILHGRYTPSRPTQAGKRGEWRERWLSRQVGQPLG